MRDRRPARAGDETQLGRAIMEFNGQWDVSCIRDHDVRSKRYPLEGAAAIGYDGTRPDGFVPGED